MEQALLLRLKWIPQKFWLWVFALVAGKQSLLSNVDQAFFGFIKTQN